MEINKKSSPPRRVSQHRTMLFLQLSPTLSLVTLLLSSSSTAGVRVVVMVMMMMILYGLFAFYLFSNSNTRNVGVKGDDDNRAWQARSKMKNIPFTNYCYNSRLLLLLLLPLSFYGAVLPFLNLHWCVSSFFSVRYGWCA
jgi:hypothetical protein